MTAETALIVYVAGVGLFLALALSIVQPIGRGTAFGAVAAGLALLWPLVVLVALISAGLQRRHDKVTP